MRIRILISVILTAMIFGLTACDSSGNMKTNSAETEAPRGSAIELTQDNSQGKEYLKEKGWVSKLEMGLGFYIPDNDDIKKEYSYIDDSNTEYDTVEYFLGYDLEYGHGIIGIKQYSLDNTIVSSESIDYLIDKIKDKLMDFNPDGMNLDLVYENDTIYLYEMITEGRKVLIVLPKNTSEYYRFYIPNVAFEDFNTETGFWEGKNYEAGDFFTEDTYEAFKYSIVYLG